MMKRTKMKIKVAFGEFLVDCTPPPSSTQTSPSKDRVNPSGIELELQFGDKLHLLKRIPEPKKFVSHQNGEEIFISFPVGEIKRNKRSSFDMTDIFGWSCCSFRLVYSWYSRYWILPGWTAFCPPNASTIFYVSMVGPHGSMRMGSVVPIYVEKMFEKEHFLRMPNKIKESKPDIWQNISSRSFALTKFWNSEKVIYFAFSFPFAISTNVCSNAFFKTTPSLRSSFNFFPYITDSMKIHFLQKI